MNVKELLEALRDVEGDLEIYSGNGDGYLSVVRPQDVNLRGGPDVGEKLIITIEGQGNSAFLHDMEKKAEAAEKEEAKPLAPTVLTALLRAYLNSLRTSFLYKDSFESLLNEESLGAAGTISDETWAQMLKDLEKEWIFVKMGIGWSFSHRKSGGP